jgi:hypothetical protein
MQSAATQMYGPDILCGSQIRPDRKELNRRMIENDDLGRI